MAADVPSPAKPPAHASNGTANGTQLYNCSRLRRATFSQVRALRAIADWQQIDLPQLLNVRFQIDEISGPTVHRRGQPTDRRAEACGPSSKAGRMIALPQALPKSLPLLVPALPQAIIRCE